MLDTLRTGVDHLVGVWGVVRDKEGVAMDRRGLKISLAVAIGLLMGAAASVPAVAGSLDGAYGRFNTSTAKGLVVLSYTGSTTVNAGMVGLVGSAEYHLIGRSIGCNGTPSQANRVFRVNRMSDADGELFFKASPAINAVVRSFWLGSNDALGAALCANSVNFSEMAFAAGGDANGDVVIGTADYTLILVEKRPQGRARVSIVFDDTSGSESINVRGVNKGCGKRPTNSFFDIFVGDLGFKTKTVDMTQSQLESLRSARYRESDFAFGCVALTLFNIEAQP